MFSRSRWLALMGMAASALAGYAIGNATRTPVIEKSQVPANEASRLVRAAGRESHHQGNAWEQLTALLAPNSREDEIWKIISRIPTKNIPEAIHELRMTQLRAATGSAEERRLAEIESALYFKWAESDPIAALADVSTRPGPPDHRAAAKRIALLKSVLAAWMRVDANAAYRAVKDHKNFGYVGRDMLVQTWTAENVFENLKQFPENNRDLLGWYCVAAAKDEAQRNAMLVALKEQPEMRDRDWGYFLLFRDWAYRDFPAAMAEAKKHDHPGLEQHVLEDGLNQQPAATMRWAVSQNIPPGGPSWERGYSNWLRFDPADAKQWLEEQAPAWTSEGHFAAVAGLQLQQLGLMEKIDMKAVQPAWVALMTKWQNKDPEAAEKWLDSPFARSQGIPNILTWKDADAHE